MYDRQTKVGVIKLVGRRDADTLMQLIQHFIRPGPTIYSDGWAAYSGLGALGFNHRVVIHADNFVDPITGVHTNGVEAYWSRAKHKLEAVYGSLDHMKPSYLDEFMWHKRYGHDRSEVWRNIRLHIAEHNQ
eukprot:gene11098-19962_t